METLEKGNICDAGLEEENSSFYGKAEALPDPFLFGKDEVIKALEGEPETLLRHWEHLCG